MSEYRRNVGARFVRALVDSFPIFRSMFDEHVSDYGEILPHLFFGDLTAFCVQLLVNKDDVVGTAGLRQLREILDYLENAYAQGGEDVEELISVSFLENFHSGTEEGAQIRQMIGPHLRKQIDIIG
jgi:hypothetical protein